MSNSKDKTAFMKKTENEFRDISILYMERNPGTPKDCCLALAPFDGTDDVALR